MNAELESSSLRFRRRAPRAFLLHRSALIALCSLTCTALTFPDRLAAQPKPSAPPPAIKTTAATPPLRLRDAIETGLTHHPLIERAQADAQAAAAETKQDEGWRYPWLEASVAGGTGSIRVLSSDGANIHHTGGDLARGFRNRSGFHTYGSGRGFALAGALPKHNMNMTSGGLILNQLITDFGTTAHRILASQATETATEKEIQTNRALVILDVQQAYLTCLLQQRLADIALDNLEKRKAIRDQVAALHRHQLRSKLDLDLMAVEVSNAELALIKARNDVTQAFAALNHAMGVDGAARYDLEGVSVAKGAAPAIAELVEQGLRERPELQGGKERVQASQELLQSMRALHFGEIAAVGTLGITKYGDVHEAGIPEDGVAPFWGFGVSARLPLFTGFHITNQIAEAGHRNGEREQELQNLANEVTLQVIRASLGQLAAAEQITLEEERVAFAKEAVELAQSRYKLGLSSIVEVVQAATALLDAQSRLAEAQFVYKKSQVLVAYAAGQDYLKYK